MPLTEDYDNIAALGADIPGGRITPPLGAHPCRPRRAKPSKVHRLSSRTISDSTHAHDTDPSDGNA